MAWKTKMTFDFNAILLQTAPAATAEPALDALEPDTQPQQVFDTIIASPSASVPVKLPEILASEAAEEPTPLPPADVASPIVGPQPDVAEQTPPPDVNIAIKYVIQDWNILAS